MRLPLSSLLLPLLLSLVTNANSFDFHGEELPPTLLEQRLLEADGEWETSQSKREMRRQLTGTVGELMLHPNDTVPQRGGACFDSWECSWFYHTRHPGSWGDCDAGTCLCEPGYKGKNCEKAPPANRFSCNDGQCYNPATYGRQSEERGGNLTITIVRAINLPDMDGFGVFGGAVQEPFLTLHILHGTLCLTECNVCSFLSSNVSIFLVVERVLSVFSSAPP